jgi:type I restriction enzyme S subunit
MNRAALPNGWSYVKLRDCCDIVSGATPRRDHPEYWDGDIPWVTPKDLSDLEMSVLEDAPEYITEQGYKSCSTTLLPKGSILFSSRAPIGLVAIAGRPMCTNQGFKSLIPGDDVDSGYLYHCMKSLVPRIQDMGRGATFAEISKELFGEIEIPLAKEIKEQKRIAAILDKADAIRRKRKKAIQLADEFLRSVFLDLFGDPVTNPKGWPVVRLDELAAKVTDGTHQSPRWTPDGVPFLFISNIVNQKISFETEKFIAEETFQELTRITPIEVGDVLYTTVGSYGNAALVTSDRKFCFQRHIAHIKPDRIKVIPEFLWAMMNSPGVRRQADKQARGVAQKTLNLGELKSFLVFNPSVAEQQKFVRFIRKVESVKESFAIGNEAYVQLFRSTSQRAFRGEL